VSQIDLEERRDWAVAGSNLMSQINLGECRDKLADWKCCSQLGVRQKRANSEISPATLTAGDDSQTYQTDYAREQTVRTALVTTVPLEHDKQTKQTSKQ